MIIGFALILGLLVTVVVAASRVFLFQRELSAMADGAALSAADGIDTSAIYAGNGVVRLDQVAATNLARSYLSDSGAGGQVPGAGHQRRRGRADARAGEAQRELQHPDRERGGHQGHHAGVRDGGGAVATGLSAL